MTKYGNYSGIAAGSIIHMTKYGNYSDIAASSIIHMDKYGNYSRSSMERHRFIRYFANVELLLLVVNIIMRIFMSERYQAMPTHQRDMVLIAS